MRVYLFEDSLELRQHLEPVTSGAEWTVKAPTYYKPNGSLIKRAAVQIAKALEALPGDIHRVSSVKLKNYAKALRGIPANTFSAAAKLLHEVTTRWETSGRSFVRVDYAEFFQ
jgi:hypothetical protein